MATSTTQSTKDIIYEIAKGVYEIKRTAMSYSKLRAKLNKQGFSEIAIYSAMARHCEENSISPSSYSKDATKLLEGCARDIFFPKTHNDYHYLRGQYHDLRHGNLDRDEPKSPEQRGMFICNSCYRVLDKKHRSGSEKDKNCCRSCRSEKQKNYYKKKSTDDEKSQAKPVDSSNSEITETEIIEVAPVEQDKPKTVTGQLELESAKVKISDVMADENEATVSLSCPTQNLHLLLAAISNLTR